MAAVARPVGVAFPAPIRIPLWAWVVALFALFGAYLMLQENGILLNSWERFHEFFHDGRHAFGVPCH